MTVLEWMRARSARRVSSRVRRRLAFFGYPTEEMTEEQVEEAAELYEAYRASPGSMVGEVAEAIRVLLEEQRSGAGR